MAILSRSRWTSRTIRRPGSPLIRAEALHMPVFTYEAMNSSGQEVKDEIDAASSDEAIAKIRNKGFFPTKIKEKALKRSAKKKKAEAAISGPTRKMPVSIGGVPRKQLVA